MEELPDKSVAGGTRESLWARLSELLSGGVRGALCGACLGAAAGAEQVLRNGYLASGLPRNAVAVLVERVGPSSVLGAAAGAVAALAILLTRPLLRRAGVARPLRVLVAVLLAVGVFGAVAWRSQRARELIVGTRPLLLAVALGVVLARVAWLIARAWRTPEARRTRFPVTWGDAVPALAFTLLLTGDSVIFARLQPARPQNVLLIAIDTLRLDRTSLTGAEVPGEFTPHLGAWAAGATVFSNAVSQAPWTLPAFASIFTGMYPRQHGAIEFGRSLRARETSLAEVLREAGYRTGAVVSNFVLRRDMGLAQGFELYDTSQIGDAEAITSGGVTQQALEFLARDDGRPFFLFAHYMDPHATYRDHAEYTEADAYRGWLRDESHHVMDLRAVSDRMGPAERDFVRHLYDEEVEYADAEIGRLLAYLRESGRDRDTVVVFVSDHGEEFLERGWIGHSRHVHDEVIRVPFAMDLPALPDAPRVVTTQVETRAIAATLLDYLGIEHELPVHAPSLLPLLQGASEAWGPRDAFSEIWLKKPAEGTTIERDRTSCLRTERWKLILTHETGALQLFDLEADPGETRDVAAEHPEVLTELEGRLRAWLAEQPGSVGGGSVALDEATQRELRALGYLGGDDAH